jgi:hypothetical protein
MGVHVVVSEWKTGAHDSFGRICDLDVPEQKLVDGTGWLAGLPVFLNVLEDGRVIGDL